MEKMRRFGLVGKSINYSFSRTYFSDKFAREQLDATYENFDLKNIAQFPGLIKANADISGLNITIPYKESIIPYLDQMSDKATQIGAVNTIRITNGGKLIGYNTDWYGFKTSLEPLLRPHHKSALILGTGGAAKAVTCALRELNIAYCFVSRTPSQYDMSYQDLKSDIFDKFQIVINCTPLGALPNIAAFPEIPYEYLTEQHIAFDLVYNPAESTFLKKAAKQGAVTKNGYDMLIFQADKAWEIWNQDA